MALVGDSGSGKSTIIQLIERFYDPSAGRVRRHELHVGCMSLSARGTALPALGALQASAPDLFCRVSAPTLHPRRCCWTATTSRACSSTGCAARRAPGAGGGLARACMPSSGPGLMHAPRRAAPAAPARPQIALVSQEPTLFNTSIYENIMNSTPGATYEDVVAAATAANAHAFISKLPKG